MGKHLQRDLDGIKKELLTSGLMVEKALNNAIESLIDRHPELAKEVISGDRLIDQKENQIEEECLKVLALYQPVANDLRLIIAVLKLIMIWNEWVIWRRTLPSVLYIWQAMSRFRPFLIFIIWLTEFRQW